MTIEALNCVRAAGRASCTRPCKPDRQAMLRDNIDFLCQLHDEQVRNVDTMRGLAAAIIPHLLAAGRGTSVPADAGSTSAREFVTRAKQLSMNASCYFHRRVTRSSVMQLVFLCTRYRLSVAKSVPFWRDGSLHAERFFTFCADMGAPMLKSEVVPPAYLEDMRFDHCMRCIQFDRMTCRVPMVSDDSRLDTLVKKHAASASTKTLIQWYVQTPDPHTVDDLILALNREGNEMAPSDFELALEHAERLEPGRGQVALFRECARIRPHAIWSVFASFAGC